MKAQANEHGVTWVTSKSGELDIALALSPLHMGMAWRVWALWHATRELAPVARGLRQERGGRADLREHAMEDPVSLNSLIRPPRRREFVRLG